MIVIWGKEKRKAVFCASGNHILSISYKVIDFKLKNVF